MIAVGQAIFARSFSSALALLAVAAAAGAARGETRRVFLWFADGLALPAEARGVCTDVPPPFECRYAASREECRAQVQSLLDRWYTAFDLHFTYTRPTEGPFDTVVVTSNGAWCGEPDTTLSRSPALSCQDQGGGPNTSVTVFQCGRDAHQCATLIAKEHAHVLGLQHTVSLTDVMNESYSPEHDGFEDRENLATSNRCGRFQNSHQLMLARLGAWPGGPKPAPGVVPPPPLPGGSGDAGFTGSDGGAGRPDTEPAVDAPAPAGSGGCQVAGPGARPGGAGAAAAGLIVAVVAGALAALAMRRRSAT